MPARRRIARPVVVLLAGALAVGLAAPAAVAAGSAPVAAPGSRLAPAALLPTTIAGFPGRTASVNQGSTFPVRATVSGPGRRVVVLQRLSGRRWVNVVTTKSSARRAVVLNVKTPAAGTFRYRLVVPRVGLFAARVSGIKVVVVKKVELKSVPGVISGTFTGKRYKGATSTPFITWTGRATYSKVTRHGNSYSYSLTDLSVDWVIDTVEGDCSYRGSGVFTLADARVQGIEGLYEPWGPFEPGRYGLDVNVRTESDAKRFPHTVSCPFQEPYQDVYNRYGNEVSLLSLARPRVLAPNATVVGGLPRSPDGETFSGSIAADAIDATGDNTWSFTGDLFLAFPRY